MGKIKSTVLMMMTLLLVFSSVFSYGGNVEASFDASVDTALLVDAETGKILYQSNIDQPLPPASMTKMMSEYLILEAVNNGEISWEQEVPISDYNAQLSHDRSLSNVPLRQDETYTVKELYETVAIYSANAATMALAELIAGSEGNFVKKMNEKGKELGLGETLREAGEEFGMDNLEEIANADEGDFQFVNSTGLPNRLLEGNHPEGTNGDEDNYMSARATGTLAFHLINDFPEVLDTASISEKKFKEGSEDEINMQNWNWMIPGTMYGDLDFEAMDGLKTGFTNAAGYTFTGTGEQNGQRFVSVVMKADSEPHRFEETQRLMEYGFNQFSEVELFPEGMTIEDNETFPVTKGKEDEVSISTEEAVSMLVLNGEEEGYGYEVAWDESLFDDKGKLIAPVEEGQVVGTMTVISEDGNSTYLQDDGSDQSQINIVTDQAVEKAGWFTLMFRSIGSFFASVWTSVADTVSGWF
ncbi:D-alanyl-D-alanine carboxypeptidase family protein [Alteribacter populi]|uniref:D-alanyl-D-alanine carboxypeptidase family protein n=1 Tax=Alteribacter populi TaxID=2011011 RepID=UPI000BBA5CCF|nr:D-alanyl-D-alanine carboxypeptidase family protein [Alteribacter populi]